MAWNGGYANRECAYAEARQSEEDAVARSVPSRRTREQEPVEEFLDLAVAPVARDCPNPGFLASEGA